MSESPAIEVLLVEDSADDAELALRAIRKSTVARQVQHVADGVQALDFLFCRGQFAQRDPDQAPDVVLLDLHLPHLDGLAVLVQIRGDRRTRAIPVIVLTSSDQERTLVDSYMLGVDNYIQKPLTPARFQEAMHKLASPSVSTCRERTPAALR
jgi:two-component system response regulator